ncbi:MAG TPA: ABC transporter permease [Longimicrobiales bacterium]
METLFHDLRYALRSLRKAPGFAGVAVLTLALGIGANTAIFSVVDGVLLRPLPYPEPDRLVSFVEAGSYKGAFLEYRERAESFEAIAAYTPGQAFSLTGRGEPVRLEGAVVSAGLFSVLGAKPLLGRTFLPGEDEAGREPVVVLSHGLWQQRFGADPGIIGEEVRLDGIARTVVGVMPPGFRFPSASTQLWVPASIRAADPIDLWGMSVGTTIARLRPGVTLEEARTEVRTLEPRMRELFPWDMPEDYGRNATVVPLRDRIVGDVRPMLLVLLGAVGFVLLIACANVANLLLARATTRRRELAVRVALGAGRRRLMRQLLTESVMLAALGGIVGLFLAFWGVELLVAGLPADTPRLAGIGIDGRVLGFTAALTFATGLVFGVLPALRASRSEPHDALKEGGRTATGARTRLSAALVVTEIALAVVLVTGAGLLIRSFWRLLRVDPGFRVENVVAATVAPPTFRYADGAARRAFYQELLGRLEALPGVTGAGITDRLPFGGRNYGSVFVIEGRPDPATQGGDWPLADIAATISADYLRTMGIRVLRGRGFTPADRADAPGVVLINQALARRYWPDEDPIGRRIRGPGSVPWLTIVGIVDDVAYNRLADTDLPAFYMPLLQHGPEVVSVVVRSTADPATLAANLRAVVASIDEDTPVSDVRAMAQRVSDSLGRPRFTMLLLTAFAAAALILGAVGIYGVIAYAVSQRIHEIGIRMALGARAGDVLGMVVRQGAALAMIGIAVGLLAAFATTRLLAGLLYGVGATDAATFLAVPLLLGAVALAASWIPARRAARVDPVVALRNE